MTEQERSIITNALGIITEVIEHSEMKEQCAYNVQLLVKEAERVAYQKAAAEEERKTLDFRMAAKKQATDAIHIRREFEALQKAHGANTEELLMSKALLSGLRQLVRDIAEQCKAQPDSVVSTVVFDKITKFYANAEATVRESLAEADAAQPVQVVLSSPPPAEIAKLREQMSDTRAERIEAAKALGETETNSP